MCIGDKNEINIDFGEKYQLGSENRDITKAEWNQEKQRREWKIKQIRGIADCLY